MDISSKPCYHGFEVIIMPAFKDLTGRQFGRLTVLKLDHKAQSGRRERYYWLCKCSCGNTHIARTDGLTSGLIRSCGCLHKEQAICNVSKHHKHKMSGTQIYHEWQGIKARCQNENNPSYPRYGGRGIFISKNWADDFQAYYDYVSSLPNFGEDGYTLDRIDNNDGYRPGNVRWATMHEQCRNRRSNIVVEYHGKRMILSDAALACGIPFNVLKRRYARGDRGDRLFREVPKNTKKPRIVEYEGKLIGLKELSMLTGVNYNTLSTRWNRGLRGHELYEL